MLSIDRLPRFLILSILLLCGTLPGAQAADPPSFNITQARASFDKNALSVSARFELELSKPVEEALHNGVPIQLLTTLDLYSQRPYIWDKHIAQWAFSNEIRYHALTSRYVLTSPQREEIRSFSTLNDLFDEIEEFSFQSDIIGETLPESKHGYKLQLRIGLDNTMLPAPLRAMTLFSSAWKLQSEVREWSIPGNP